MTDSKPAYSSMGGIMNRGHRAFYRTLRFLFSGLMKLYFRAEVHGRDHIPRTGGFILCPVHRSYIDTPVATAITPRIMRFMGKETMWKKAGFGAWFLNCMGGFPVQRGEADRQAIRAAEGLLKRGEPLVMFPEGTRRDGLIVQAEHMQDGAAFVSGRAQVPIVPMGIAGTDKALPRGAKFVFPRKMVFVIGPPIPPPEQVNGRVPRKAVKRHTEMLRGRIQELYDEALALAR
ncbi:MAG: 1-acyl-sn-glycerol-3-phosphate acyltransferase [Acidimicrobiales bacterium]|nr:1-acyl-sn-glycerol-3-phosphate acyltransferase [Acidimicrobiales bacterium]